MTIFAKRQEKHGFNTEASPISTSIFNAVMAAGTPISVAVPANAKVAKITNQTSVFLGLVTFVLPVAVTFTEDDVELIPDTHERWLDCEGLAFLWFNSAAALNRVSVAFYE